MPNSNAWPRVASGGTVRLVTSNEVKSVSRAKHHASTRGRARGTPTRVDAMSASDIERLRALLVDQKAAAASAMELLDACAPRTSVEDDLFGPDDESARGAEAERASALRALAATVHADLLSWTETWREFAGLAVPSNPAPAPRPLRGPRTRRVRATPRVPKRTSPDERRGRRGRLRARPRARARVRA